MKFFDGNYNMKFTCIYQRKEASDSSFTSDMKHWPALIETSIQ